MFHYCSSPKYSDIVTRPLLLVATLVFLPRMLDVLMSGFIISGMVEQAAAAGSPEAER